MAWNGTGNATLVGSTASLIINYTATLSTSSSYQEMFVNLQLTEDTPDGGRTRAGLGALATDAPHRFGCTRPCLSWKKLVLVALFCLLIVITVVGNTLVILSVLTTRRLRTVTNCFVMSLAVADWLVGIFVMPPAVIVFVVESWQLGWILCDIWISLDVLLCTASILSLCAISVDRYLAVTQPLTYSKRRRSKRLALLMIFVVWLVALAITCPPILGWYDQDRRTLQSYECHYNQNKGYVVFSAMGSFFIPMTVMLYVYSKICCVLTSRQNRMTKTEVSCRSFVPTEIGCCLRCCLTLQIASCSIIPRKKDTPTSAEALARVQRNRAGNELWLGNKVRKNSQIDILVKGMRLMSHRVAYRLGDRSGGRSDELRPRTINWDGTGDQLKSAGTSNGSLQTSPTFFVQFSVDILRVVPVFAKVSFGKHSGYVSSLQAMQNPTGVIPTAKVDKSRCPLRRHNNPPFHRPEHIRNHVSQYPTHGLLWLPDVGSFLCVATVNHRPSGDNGRIVCSLALRGLQNRKRISSGGGERCT
ncbi:AGAP004034-PA-like protein [Anopheles sinensis]|uniref:AGAP004034-PA-like protein n=1 Tax=Anopheles sinensis TaxID=74873 RepID=A0A084VTK1_ANOSI|nr:AGAP004034-PA-like protein [Anopheles sinensis]